MHGFQKCSLITSLFFSFLSSQAPSAKRTRLRTYAQARWTKSFRREVRKFRSFWSDEGHVLRLNDSHNTIGTTNKNIERILQCVGYWTESRGGGECADFSVVVDPDFLLRYVGFLKTKVAPSTRVNHHNALVAAVKYVAAVHPEAHTPKKFEDVLKLLRNLRCGEEQVARRAKKDAANLRTSQQESLRITWNWLLQLTADMNEDYEDQVKMGDPAEHRTLMNLLLLLLTVCLTPPRAQEYRRLEWAASRPGNEDRRNVIYWDPYRQCFVVRTAMFKTAKFLGTQGACVCVTE
jgi:hypothetical protein